MSKQEYYIEQKHGFILCIGPNNSWPYTFHATVSIPRPGNFSQESYSEKDSGIMMFGSWYPSIPRCLWVVLLYSFCATRRLPLKMTINVYLLFTVNTGFSCVSRYEQASWSGQLRRLLIAEEVGTGCHSLKYSLDQQIVEKSGRKYG